MEQEQAKILLQMQATSNKIMQSIALCIEGLTLLSLRQKHLEEELDSLKIKINLLETRA